MRTSAMLVALCAWFFACSAPAENVVPATDTVAPTADAAAPAPGTVAPAPDVELPAANPQESATPITGGESPSLVDSLVTELDEQQENVSSQLESYARSIDAFFGGDRAFEDINETSGQISAGMYPKEAQGARFDFRLRVKVDLPRTKRRTRLLIESDPKELGEENKPAGSVVGAAQEANYGVALETQLKDTGKWVISPATGIKVSSWPPDPYARVRAVRYEALEKWLTRLSSGASFYVVKGPALNARLDFDRSWVADKLFRISTEVDWKKDFENDYHEVVSATQSFGLFQTLNERMSIAYGTGVVANDDPVWWVDSYFINATYRQAIYKKWIFLNISPELTFPEDRNYSATWGIQLRLEAFFGRNYR